MQLRRATGTDAKSIWIILQDAIEKRRLEGSRQWQMGYPNLEVVKSDIEEGVGYVIEENEGVVAYAAIIFGIDPAYNHLKGEWLSDGKYVVLHRIATAAAVRRKGYAVKLLKMAEQMARGRGIFSIRLDTNFDNDSMLYILKKLDYTYCGEVLMRGEPRMAFEKLLF